MLRRIAPITRISQYLYQKPRTHEFDAKQTLPGDTPKIKEIKGLDVRSIAATCSDDTRTNLECGDYSTCIDQARLAQRLWRNLICEEGLCMKDVDQSACFPVDGKNILTHPRFKDDWWLSNLSMAPTESDVLKVVTLAGFNSKSSTACRNLSAAERLYYQQQNDALLQSYIKCLHTAMEVQKGDPNCQHITTTARNLSWRILNLRILMPMGDSRKTHFYVTRRSTTTMEDVPLLVTSMTILALRTMAAMLRNDTLEWTYSDEQTSSRNLVLNMDQLSGSSAILIPPTHVITPKELWSTFVETAGYLSTKDLVDQGLDDTCLFVNLALNRFGPVENITACALMDAWLSLIHLIPCALPAPELKATPVAGCLMALINGIESDGAFLGKTLQLETSFSSHVVMAAGRELIGHLERYCLERRGAVLSRPFQHTLWSLQFTRGILRLLNLVLADDAKRQLLCTLLSSIFRVQINVRSTTATLVRKYADLRTPDHARSVSHHYRMGALLPAVKTQRFSVQSARVLLEELLTTMHRAAPMDGIALMAGRGLQATRLRLTPEEQTQCASVIERWRQTCVPYPSLIAELAEWPVQVNAKERMEIPDKRGFVMTLLYFIGLFLAVTVMCVGLYARS